jgi:predicted metal-binding membrane protein
VSTTAALRPSRPPSAVAQAGLIVVLLALAASAWVLTDQRMGGMDASPGGDLGGVGWFALTWLVMMAAMMLGPVTPMIVTYTREWPRAGGTPLFVAGYLVAWLAAGLFAYALVEAVRSLELGFLAWDKAGRYVAGGVIMGAALYQLTVPKDACLRRCRNPRRFLQENWRPGRAGALRMGMEHGSFCVGCCWALAAALFALGVMSIGWMAFVAALIAAERLLPWKALASGGIAILLAVLALGVALTPEDVPGLMLPGSQSMDSVKM